MRIPMTSLRWVYLRVENEIRIKTFVGSLTVFRKNSNDHDDKSLLLYFTIGVFTILIRGNLFHYALTIITCV